MTVVGTRPELIRLSLVFEQLAAAGVDHHLVHTGQNYDPRLSDIFFEELELPAPDAYLGIQETTVGAQIGEVISRSERELLSFEPDALLILGDTNSGLSAVAAARHDMPIFHMEAGNRCFDWRVPEEKNRKLIDHMSDWLLPYTPRSREYLLAEGLAPQKILVSGNPITDILEHFEPKWSASDVLDSLGLDERGYVLVTAHRQETVDFPERLRVICTGLGLVARRDRAAGGLEPPPAHARQARAGGDRAAPEHPAARAVRVPRLRPPRVERAASWSRTAGRCRRSAASCTCRP